MTRVQADQCDLCGKFRQVGDTRQLSTDDGVTLDVCDECGPRPVAEVFAKAQELAPRG